MNFQDRSQLRSSAKPALLLAFLCALPAFGKYGDTVKISGTSAVPVGWVIIETTTPAMMWAAPVDFGTVQAAQSHTIKDVYGAPYGTRVIVRSLSPVPPGWVTTKVLPGDKKEIMNLGDEQKQSGSTPTPATSSSSSTTSGTTMPPAGGTVSPGKK